MTLDDAADDDLPLSADESGPCDYCTRRAVAVGPRSTRWYVVVTKPMQEQRAAKELRQQGFDVFCPLIEAPPRRRDLDAMERIEAIGRAVRAASRRRGRPREPKSPRLRPALRRYVLVAIDVQRDAWGAIRSTRGVAEDWILCMVPGTPFPIPEREVEALQRAVMTHGKKADGVQALLKAGTMVTVLHGAMATFAGPVVRHYERGDVVVELGLFGRSVRLTLRRGDVESI